MRRRIAAILSALLVLAAACGGLLLAGCGATSSSTAVSPTPAAAPPSWLLARMARIASNAGDPAATGWWALTTLEKAAVVGGRASIPEMVAHPHRAVYVAILHGNFTKCFPPLPSGASSRPYSWIAELIDPHSHITELGVLGGKPFRTSGLQMHPVELSLAPATQSPSTATSAQPSAAPAWLQRAASLSLKGFTASQTAGSPLDSVLWTKTTGGNYELAIGGHGDATSTRPVYVVVAYGSFISNLSHPASADDPTPSPLTGHVLVLAFDARTHELGNIDLLHTDAGLRVSVLGEMSPMPLATD